MQAAVFAGLLTLPLILLSYAFFASPHSPSVYVPQIESVRPAPSPEQLAHAAANPAPVHRRQTRLVYPYSVVPGGVHSASDLEDARTADPLVARHYAAFKTADLRVIRLERSQRMYISYRKQNKIYWTRKPHLIPAGEMIISDGKVSARTRCGNRLSPKPEAVTLPAEPSEEELSHPVAAIPDPAWPPATLHASSLVPAFAPEPPPGTHTPGLPGGGGVPPINPPNGGGTPGGGGGTGGGGGGGGGNPTPTPEPGTFLLVSTGIAAAWAKRRRDCSTENE